MNTRWTVGQDLSKFCIAVQTVHPSYLLRLPDPVVREREYTRFVEDLLVAAALC